MKNFMICAAHLVNYDSEM